MITLTDEEHELLKKEANCWRIFVRNRVLGNIAGGRLLITAADGPSSMALTAQLQVDNTEYMLGLGCIVKPTGGLYIEIQQLDLYK